MELAVSLTFLMILLTVMVDLAWAFYTLISMRDAAQEAAVYGAMCPGEDALVKDRLRESATSPLDLKVINPDSDIDVEWLKVNPDNTVEPAAPVKGNSVRVTFRYQHQIVVPFAATFIGTDRYTLSVNVSDTILRDETIGCN